MDTQWAQKYLDILERDEIAQKMQAFYDLLVFYNEKFNLTRIIGREECRVKHFWDSICAETYFPAAQTSRRSDPAQGFPRCRLKSCGRSFVRIGGVRRKKCVFLREAVKELGLKNMQVIHMRAEDGGKNRAYREKFDVCCARAVARLNTLSEYCVPFVKIGGRFIAYKGSAEEELREAENAFRVLGVKTVACERYDLPEEMGKRTLIVAEKIFSIPAAYPRGNGKERGKTAVTKEDLQKLAAGGKICALTGHRKLGYDFDETQLKEIFVRLIGEGFTLFLSGMAVGFDTGVLPRAL